MNKKLLLLFLLLCGGTGLARSAGFEEINSLSPPAISLQDERGRVHTLKADDNKVVLLNFWASWCPPCQKEMPSMQRLMEKMQGRAFDIIAVDTGESAKDSRQFLKQMKVGFTVVFDPDGAAAKRWKVFAMPTTFLLDKKGKIRYALPGGTEWDEGEALAHVEKLLAEQ